MPSETIWSNKSSQPETTQTQYRTVLDKINPEVAKMLSSETNVDSTGRHFSINDDSDVDSGIFGLQRGPLSAITAPVYPGQQNSTGPQRLNFGTASISGGIASRHPPQDSFLQKFSSVADATRDIELSNGLSSIALDGPPSRRTSFNNDSGIKSLTDVTILSSPHGSLNENLNISSSRTSRHQSISDKIDHYNNTSPIQAGASLSINSEQASTKPQSSNKSSHAPSHNFWNPGAASSFTPTAPNSYFMDGAMFPGMVSTPPFPQGFPSQIPRKGQNFSSGFIAPNMKPFEVGGSDLENDTESKSNENDTSTENSTDPSKAQGMHSINPGIGLGNRQIPTSNYMFFNPYSAYPSPPNILGMEQPDSTTQPSDRGVSTSPSIDKPTSNFNQNSHMSSGKRKGPRNSNNRNGNHIYRSPLLEEVRSNFKSKEYFLKDIYGHAIEFTKDQHGSRFIQQKLQDASDEEKEVIFNEFRETSYDLMTDVFGNYVIQKYFEYGSDTQRQILLEHMLGKIYELSLQMYGCRVVQRALEAVDLQSQIKLIEELRNYVLICAKDQNGNHVIQKSIEKIPFEHVRFILESLDSHIYHLSTHPYGCRVIQRLLEYSGPEDQRKILSELNRFIFYLIQDQYGNYVMQHILERGELDDREEILKVVLGSVVEFSKHKFASNVIEKCIKFGSHDQRKRILHEVMIGNEDFNVEVVDGESPLALMMKDQYANYVIQKLVEGFDAKSEEKRILVVKLRQYLKQISSKNTYGKHLASVEKMIIVAETALDEAENK